MATKQKKKEKNELFLAKRLPEGLSSYHITLNAIIKAQQLEIAIESILNETQKSFCNPLVQVKSHISHRTTKKHSIE